MTPAIHEPADDLIDALIDLVEARQGDEPDLAVCRCSRFRGPSRKDPLPRERCLREPV